MTDAWLRAANFCDPHDLVPAAVDQLERVVGGAYRPGGGVAHEIDGPEGAQSGRRERGGLSDHVRASSALLTAFEITGRLPYSMLAKSRCSLLRELLTKPAATILSSNATRRVLCRLGRARRPDAAARP
jgi:hypothetical protein